MRFFVLFCAVAGLLGVEADAQLVSSHAPTAAATRPASGSPAGEPSSALLTATGKPVVSVNGSVLTDRDLVHELYVIFPYGQIHNGIPKSMEPEMRRGALEMIVFDELVYQDAVRRKLTVPSSKYEEARARFMKQFPDQASFQAFMAQECKGSQQEFKRKLTRTLLVDVVTQQEIKAKARVTDVEARRYYDHNLKKFDRPESFHFQSISIIPPSNASPDVKAEARKHAEAALKAAKGTKNYQEFGLIAEKYSEDDFKVNFGDHKMTERSKLPPEVINAALALKPGEVSGLISLGPNYTIIRLIEHAPAGRQSFESVRKELRENLEKFKTEQLRKELYSRLRKGATIKEF